MRQFEGKNPFFRLSLRVGGRNLHELDASRQLKCLRPGLDVVVKANDSLPFIPRGGDIDVYTLDAEGLIRSLIDSVRDASGLTSQVQEVSRSHIHFDIISGTSLEFRVDIYSSFPRYTRFSVKDRSFGAVVLSGRSNLEDDFPRLGKKEEAFVRYLEYCEFYWVGPEKPHHFDWIMSTLTPDERGQLFTEVHLFIEPRRVNLGKPSRNRILKAISLLSGSRIIQTITPAGLKNRVAKYASKIDS